MTANLSIQRTGASPVAQIMNTNTHQLRTIVPAAIGCLLLLGMLAMGCSQLRSGQRISRELTAFIQPGNTTRAEIVSNFGAPSLELNESRVIAYYWQTQRGESSGPVWHEGIGFERESKILGLWDWAFCLRFDPQDRVVTMETLKVNGNNSISEAVKRWATGQDAVPGT